MAEVQWADLTVAVERAAAGDAIDMIAMAQAGFRQAEAQLAVASTAYDEALLASELTPRVIAGALGGGATTNRTRIERARSGRRRPAGARVSVGWAS
jgi:hypothetical protein